MLVFYLFSLLLGIIVGSFLNACVYRLDAGIGLSGRSFCPSCKHILGWLDLVPVFSWVALRGKCRYCSKPISIGYPLVELSTGLLFLAVTVNIFSLTLEPTMLANLLFWYLVSACLVLIFVYDLKHQIIPDEAVYTALVASLIFAASVSLLEANWTFFMKSLAAGLAAGGFFYLIALVSKGRWMGGGDVKLAALMGLALGFSVVVALYSAFILGAIVGLAFVGMKRKKMSSKIPFGPFLITGTFIALFFGSSLISFYVTIFL